MSEPKLIFDLSKAANVSRLVQKIVTVHMKSGKVFTRKQLVNPNDIIKQVSKVFDIIEFEKLKSDKAAAIKYLKDHGITWKENPHEGVNWMRASMAAKKASTTPASTTNAKASGNKTASVSKNSTAKATAPNTQNNVKLDYMSLASKGYDKADGKTKAKIIKTTVDKDTFMKLASGVVKWDTHTHEGINMMRASLAFSEWAGSHSLDDLSVALSGSGLDSSTQDAAKKAEPPKDAPAKKSNKGTKVTKDVDPKKEDKPEAKDTSIPVPSDADNRTKNLITLINSLQSKDDLDTVKSLGIIAEDDVSMDYLKNTLLPKSAEQKQNRGYVSGAANKYGAYANETIFSALDKTLKTTSKRVLSSYISTDLPKSMSAVNFTAPRSVLRLNTRLKGDYSQNYASEMELYRRAGGDSVASGESPSLREFMNSMYRNFGTYDAITDDDSLIQMTNNHPNAGLSAVGNRDLYRVPITELEKRFDKDKDGYLRALKLISEKRPELKSAAKTMGDRYLKVLKLCGYQPGIIEYLLTSDETLKADLEDRENKVKAQKAIMTTIKSQVSSGEFEMIKAHYEYGLRWSSYYTVDVDPNNHYHLKFRNKDYDYTKPQSDTNKSWYEFDIDLSNTKVDGKHVSEYFKDRWGNPSIKLIAESLVDVYQDEIDRGLYTPANRDALLQAVQDLMQVELRTDGKSPYNTYDTELYLKPNDNVSADYDAVLSNLLRMNDVAKIRSSMCKSLARKFTNSNANDRGSKLEGIFDFVDTDYEGIYRDDADRSDTPYLMYAYNKHGNGNPDKYSYSQMIDKIKKQTEDIPVFGLDDYTKLKSDLIKYAEDRSDEIPLSYKGGYHLSSNGGGSVYDTRYDLIGGKDSKISVWYNKADHTEHNVPTSHPLCDIMVETLNDLVLHSPSIRNTRIKTDEDVKDLLARNLGLKASQDEDTDANEVTLELRKQVLNNVKCSIKSLPVADYESLQHRIKMAWDQKVHGGNSAKFYGAYQINNLPGESKLKEESQRINETPSEFFHGTSFGGTAGILGATGGFSVDQKTQSAAGANRAGAMLGQGVYLAQKSSKSAQYFSGYNQGRYGRGTLFICDAIMGKKAMYDRDSWRYDDSFDTVEASEASNSRGTLYNDEWAVRHPEWVLPKIMIDMENTRRV